MSISVFSTGKVSIKTRFSNGMGWGIFRKLNIIGDKDYTPYWPVNVYVINHPEGVIVVDTGELAKARDDQFYSPLNRLFIKNSARFDISEEMEIGPQLRRHNISCDRIRWVIPTHLHQDHMNGLAHFAGCSVLISSLEYRNFHSITGSLNGYMPDHFPDDLKVEIYDFNDPGIGPFEKSHFLTSDQKVRLVPVPGHTLGHIAVIYENEGIFYFFAGDAAFSQEHLLKGIADGVCMNAQAQKRSLKKIRQFSEKFSTVFLPTHDPLAVQRLEKSEIVPNYKGQ